MCETYTARVRSVRAAKIALVTSSSGSGIVRAHVAGARLRAHVLPREVARAVLQVGRQDLVTRLQVERARRHVHARRRVLDEGQVVRLRADVVRQRGSRVREQAAQAA